MNDKQNEMTREEAEEDFKNAVANAFSKRISDVCRDEDGFIVLHRKARKRGINSEDKS